MSEEEKTRKSAEGSIEKKADESSQNLTDVIAKALGPIGEKLDAIAAKVDSQDTRIEKMERAREPAKGGSPDNTEKPVSKSEGGEGGDNSSGAADDGSVFASIMPPHLRGRVRR